MSHYLIQICSALGAKGVPGKVVKDGLKGLRLSETGIKKNAGQDCLPHTQTSHWATALGRSVRTRKGGLPSVTGAQNLPPQSLDQWFSATRMHRIT